MSKLCDLHGMSRQSFYQYDRQHVKEQLHEQVVVEMIQEIRRKQPQLGGRKLHRLLQEPLHQLGYSLGRDKFFDLLSRHGLLVKRKKKYAKTTNSFHRYRTYDNLIKSLVIERVHQVWVSDITYIRLSSGFCYLALVTDLYSRKIVGYDLSLSLSLDGALRALQMALKDTPGEGLIHHSDRGVQYCADDYIALLQNHGARISMGEAGNPYENAVAERLNGILKDEYFLDATFTDFVQAHKAVKEAIETYNNWRPHMSLNYRTPAQVHQAA
ncbi:IS3 family transposase [bacterium]|nr:IS3 family transposase [bacterium]MCI0617898.1 IS3 family transposase [bacterium]